MGNPMKHIVISLMWLLITGTGLAGARDLQSTARGFEGVEGGERCDIGIENCRTGETCRFDIVIDGEVAAKLYELMSRHGIDKGLSELLGTDYVVTSDDLITCSKEPSGPQCHFAYDVPHNKATGVRICE